MTADTGSDYFNVLFGELLVLFVLNQCDVARWIDTELSD